jgi:iron complex transport system substrate-binding protein
MSVRALALAALVFVASAGCGGGADDQAAETKAATTVAEPAVRPVEHAMGATEITGEPERIVGLDYDVLDTVTALGYEPVGGTEAIAGLGIPEYLRGQVSGMELVGTIEEPSLEAIAALQPDLILSSKVRHEQIYDELSAIAPTVFAEDVGPTWKENVLVYGEALGKRQEAETLLAEYERRAAELGERIQEAFGGQKPTISVVRFLPGETRIYTKDNFIGSILEDVGLPRPKPQDVDEFALYPSEEQIGLMAGDVIFYTHYGPEAETTLPQVTSNPLWKNLEAVRQGRAYNVPEDHWIVGIGVQAASLVLDDLERILLEGR